MMQLPLATRKQGEHAFKLFSGSPRLHEVLSIEGWWQGKRTQSIKRSGWTPLLLGMQTPQPAAWLVKPASKLASNLCKGNLSPAEGHLKSLKSWCWVLVAHAAGQHAPCFWQGIHEPLTEIDDFLKLFVAYVLMKGNEMKPDYEPCKASPYGAQV